ncbi:DUF6759 domain-containing protein [Halpernia frigidisoli]|uniref:DUF6759 domain-containing protein n=1 Tax=Halpernia frigidisoli TaxID=1125876 RepID=A0A1I3HWW1_9FLAO|nr:DUF6759 domain-containing protein [Halpernia frigidisoli]SFI40236.1 hypothetical protein SAMN05443292_2437 [Halpernia frigidisoli]
MDEIQEFLDTANHEDPRFQLCKKRLVELKNRSWMTRKNPADFMTARPIVEVTKIFLDEAEFKALQQESLAKHTTKTVNLLNALFNPDLKSDERIVMIQNQSDCNLILNYTGNSAGKLAISSHGEDFIIIKKGDYNLSANVCDAPYNSAKSFTENQIISLGYSAFAENKFENRK